MTCSELLVRFSYVILRVSMGEHGFLTFGLINWANHANQIKRIKSTFTTKLVNWSLIRRANRTNIMNKQINIHLFRSNRTNIYSFICNIRPICLTNHKLAERITNQMESISWFAQFSGANMYHEYLRIGWIGQI